MKMGIVFFSFVKIFQGKSKVIVPPEKYVLVSYSEKLRETLEKEFKKSVSRVELIGTITANKNTEIILDQYYLSFKIIIETLESLKNKGFTFKILPRNADFIIGSNSSFDRGEVKKI